MSRLTPILPWGVVGFADRNVRAPVVAVFYFIVLFVIFPVGAQSAIFETKQLDGSPSTLFTNKTNKGTVLIFVAPECPIANKFAPIVESLRKTHATNFTFWIVYPGEQTLEMLKKHQKDYWPQFQALVDPKHKLTDMAAARRTPQAAVFNQNGNLVYTGRIDDRAADFGKWRQTATDLTLEKALDALTANQNIRLPSIPAVGCLIPR